MFWFIALLLLVGAGFYFYQKMMAIEQEIRAEQEAEQPAPSVSEPVKEKEQEPAPEPEPEVAQDDEPDPHVVTPEVEKMTAKADPVADEALSLEDEILAAVENLPGMKQTEIYESFTDVSKKQLQQLIKDMADSGKLKREKKGNSYLLYPI